MGWHEASGGGERMDRERQFPILLREARMYVCQMQSGKLDVSDALCGIRDSMTKVGWEGSPAEILLELAVWLEGIEGLRSAAGL